LNKEYGLHPEVATAIDKQQPTYRKKELKKAVNKQRNSSANDTRRTKGSMVDLLFYLK
jgi:hypothetical protein